jgi:hypothetical protein
MFPVFTTLLLVFRPLSPASRVSVPCLPSDVPSFMSLFLTSRHLSPVSRLCSLSSILCILSYVICPQSPILLSPSPNPYQLSHCPIFVVLFHCSCPFSPVSRPLFLRLFSSVHFLRVFLVKHMHTILVGTSDGCMVTS